ncbi:IS110 family transposase [Hyphomonas sp.]|uniref:IS110 family transposase n=1 Tax=Hyphomonas sp. TaxID=87 RepID=UPI0025BF14B1|nr:IS110 family transposase [Hyphomonas sp.]
MQLSTTYIGVDVAKAWIDIFNPDTRQHARCKNDPMALADWINTLKDERVVFEATSGCDAALIANLSKAGVGYVRVNPLQARQFARAAGVLSKTDRVDARMLSSMGQALQLDASRPPEPHRERLSILHARRGDVVSMIVAEQSRLSSAHEQWVRKDIASSIKLLTRRRERIQAEIDLHIQSHADLAEQTKCLQSAPGVGPQIACTLIANLPELGKTDRRAIANLAGLAPHAHESGRQTGKRKIWGGRSQVRKAMYIAALVAIRWDKHWKAVYLTMREAGKPAKVAMIAVARRLLVRLNAMMKTGTIYSN